MKKILYLMVLLLLTGCQEKELFNSQQENVRVTAGFAATRTTFTEDGNVTHVSWEKDDEIGIYTKTQSDLAYRAKEAGRETEFYNVRERLQAAEGDSVYAVYPMLYYYSYPLIPTTRVQRYGENYTDYDFIYAANEVKDGQVALQFKHLFAYLKITIPAEMLPGREGGEGSSGLWISSTENIGLSNGGFDVNTQTVISAEFTDYITYIIPDSIQSGDLTCYVAILPQSSEAELKIYRLVNNGIGINSCLIAKKAPAGGFKAGNIYTLYLDEDEIAAQQRAERDALIAFYKATDGDNWTNNENWCSDKPLNEWHGVGIDGRVVRLDLILNNLNGSITDAISYLSELTHLEYLDLSENRLSGEIPEEIGNLKELEQLALRSCQISGELPQSICNLKNLILINLSDNQLTGEVPPFYLDNPQLYCIGLSNNAFTGPLPEMDENWDIDDWYGGCWLALENNKFTGNIPKSYARLMKPHSFIDVSFNNLNGELPTEISQHEHFHAYWPQLIIQNEGYGFNRVDIPSNTNTVKCYDGSFVDLGEEYASHKYTVIFVWEPWCLFSIPYMPLVEQLYNKYKEKGLGVLGMTLYQHPVGGLTTLEEFNDCLAEMPSIKHFWAVSETLYESYNNNPYSVMTNGFFLFYLSYTPNFYIVDNQGEIICFSSGTYSPCTPLKSVPQYLNDDVLKYIANLFGDEDFVPDYYTSTDYSKDGEVVTLQTASVGKGIDLVFMGEGFTDKDMDSGGKYEQKMEEAMEQYFSIEPYKTFRNRFNCYAVKVVSPNEGFNRGAVHRINEDDEICIEYASKVPGINTDKWQISVIYNTEGSAGRSYTVMYGDGTFVGYMMEGVNIVLNHEVGGHGFAKLLDEYVEPGYESLTFPDENKDVLDFLWENWGWGANVDWRNDWTTVKWSRLLNDSRYVNEGLGLYEGAYLYGYGAYRPTENSMMRYNDSPFNAPSREQIYKCIMQQSEGDSWTYNYEEFVEYDAINRNTATTRALQTLPSEAARKEWQQRHRPPVFVKGTWRDAVKRKQRK